MPLDIVVSRLLIFVFDPNFVLFSNKPNASEQQSYPLYSYSVLNDIWCLLIRKREWIKQKIDFLYCVSFILTKQTFSYVSNLINKTISTLYSNSQSIVHQLWAHLKNFIIKNNKQIYALHFISIDKKRRSKAGVGTESVGFVKIDSWIPVIMTTIRNKQLNSRCAAEYRARSRATLDSC